MKSDLLLGARDVIAPYPVPRPAAASPPMAGVFLEATVEGSVSHALLFLAAAELLVFMFMFLEVAFMLILF